LYLYYFLYFIFHYFLVFGVAGVLPATPSKTQPVQADCTLYTVHVKHGKKSTKTATGLEKPVAACMSGFSKPLHQALLRLHLNNKQSKVETVLVCWLVSLQPQECLVFLWLFQAICVRSAFQGLHV